MKRTPTIPITPRQARVAAKLCEILYSDYYHPEEKRVLRAWIRAHAKAQKLKRRGYKVSVPVRPGRPQVIVVKGKLTGVVLRKNQLTTS